MLPVPSELKPCDRCDAPILWTTTVRGNRMPLDPTPDPAGNTAAYRDSTRTWRSRALAAGALPPAPWEHIYKPHAATCPRPAPVQQPLPGLTQTVGPARRPTRRRRPLPQPR